MPEIRTFARWSCAAALLCATPLFAQVPVEGPVETTATVAVESKHPVTLDPKMVKVEVDGRTTELVAISRVQPATAQVAILIDEGLRSSFGTQLDDMRQFILSLPPGMQVLVGYMRNGTVAYEGSGFSTELGAVARNVRMPMAVPGISASPYFCLSDFVKKWPSDQPGRRFVLMLTNGVDPYNGSTSIMNQNSPYVEDAQRDAQRAGVAVYSIPYHDAGMRFGSFSGQSYLSQVADATGGMMLYQGNIGPVSLAPILSDFRKELLESYTAVFMASSNREKKDTLMRLKISSSQQGVKLHAPDLIHPGR